MKWYEVAIMSGKKLPGELEKWAIIQSLRSKDKTPALVALHRRVIKKKQTAGPKDHQRSD